LDPSKSPRKGITENKVVHAESLGEKQRGTRRCKQKKRAEVTFRLILGGDVVAMALAQLAGGGFTPAAFSFGMYRMSTTEINRWSLSILMKQVGSPMRFQHLGRTASCCRMRIRRAGSSTQGPEGHETTPAGFWAA
jgi:hypothetical protein